MACKRHTVALDDDQLATLRERFDSIDTDHNGTIDINELHVALEAVGLSLPGFEIRDLIKRFDTGDRDGKLNLEEFKALYAEEKAKRDVGVTFKKAVSTRQGVATMGGTSYASSEGTTHTVKEGEEKAFAEWIISNLEKDTDCRPFLPDKEGSNLCNKVGNGILLCKLINHSVPKTIDERAINKQNLSVYRCHENLTLAINSASSIGCTTVNIGPEDLADGKPHLTLGLLWQIIRIGLLNDINLAHFPGLVALLKEGETIEDLIRLSPEQILLRWVNFHLQRAGVAKRIDNFGEDIKDSEAYIHLLHQIAPADSGVDLRPLGISQGKERAEAMLVEAAKISCRSFIGPDDVVNGNQKLNLAFVANLFNTYPALEKPPKDTDSSKSWEESREEKTYRNWMNSLGVTPFVHNLYCDLHDGKVIFQLYDFIQPGLVDWQKVVTKYSNIVMKRKFEKVENCNYAVELGPCLELIKLKLVGISGSDIHDGNETLTLGLVWQLMRAYTLSILTKLSGQKNPIQDAEVIQWVNEKLKGEMTIENFSDKKLSDGVVMAKVIDAIKPGIVNWDNISMDAKDTEEKLANARYAIGLARKIGAGVYALPEDIEECKHKMLLTVFACLMVRDLSAGNLTQQLTKNGE